MMKTLAEPSIMFLRARFPGKTWTSIAILCNPKMGLHRDLLNLRGHPNHAVALGLFTGGRVWVEDENGDAAEEVNMKTKVRSSDPGTTYMTSRLLSTRGAFIKSNLMKGTYTPQAFKCLQMKMLPDFHRWAFRFLHNSHARTKSHSGPGGQKLRKDRNLED